MGATVSCIVTSLLPVDQGCKMFLGLGIGDNE